MSVANWSLFRQPHSKNDIEHLYTRYIAPESMEMWAALSEAMVAAQAFKPTKCTLTNDVKLPSKPHQPIQIKMYNR